MTWTSRTPMRWAEFDHYPEWDEHEAAWLAAAERFRVEPLAVTYFVVSEDGEPWRVGFYVHED